MKLSIIAAVFAFIAAPSFADEIPSWKREQMKRDQEQECILEWNTQAPAFADVKTSHDYARAYAAIPDAELVAVFTNCLAPTDPIVTASLPMIAAQAKQAIPDNLLAAPATDVDPTSAESIKAMFGR